MRFIADGPIIPDFLLSERDAGRVVFLCGAGVSIPSGMPSFQNLTKFVIDRLGPGHDSEIRKAFSAWHPESETPVTARMPLDQIFNLLQLEYGRDPVGKLVSEKLVLPDPDPDTLHAKEHGIISRISANQEGIPQIVTTNFDLLFEHALSATKIQTYVPPTFPDLKHNVPVTGITYLHGRLSDTSKDVHDYVLSSADFGRAYLAQGWATSFIQQLLQNYTVVLLGYQAEDPPVKYLLQGLNSSQDHNKKRLFAFDQGENDVIEAKWRDRGVTPIAYPESQSHQALWDTLDAWAARADSPVNWKSSVVDHAKQSPSALKPHERGIVSHLLRTSTGAKQFADAEPRPPIEWLCVFDRTCRFAKPSKSLMGGAEQFDPLITYGLDDDPPRPAERAQESLHDREDLTEWRRGDDSLDYTQQLAGFRPGFEPMPSRLFHLARWMLSHINDPALAWWVARQSHLHPRLLEMLKRSIEDSDQITEDIRQLWTILFESIESPSDDPVNNDWFHVRRRLKTSGWNSSVIRLFEQVTEPKFKVSRPIGISASRPPIKDWSTVRWEEIANIDLYFSPLHGKPPEVPEPVLSSVFSVLQRNLIRATERLNEVGRIWLQVSTLYPEKANDDDRHVEEQDAYINWFLKLFDRMADSDPKLLRAYIDTWPNPEKHIFDKLRLFAWNKGNLFTGREVSERILSLMPDQFWRSDNERELLFLLRDRWADFSTKDQERIALRLLDGRAKYESEGKDEYLLYKSRRSVIIFGWLIKAGCDMPLYFQEKWQELKNKLPEWHDSWIDEAASTNESRSGFVSINEDTSVLDGVPLNRIIAVAEEHSRSELGEFIDHKPFLGLVKNKPIKAFMALFSAAKHNVFPTEFWRTLLQNWPDDAPNRITYMLLRLVYRLPPAVVFSLRWDISDWLKYQFPKLAISDESQAYNVFDHLVDKILSHGAEATKSGIGETRVGGDVVLRSRRTLDYAINGPIGKATEGLLTVLQSKNLQQGVGLPHDFTKRVEHLLTVKGEGSDHVACIPARQTAQLNAIDPNWTSQWILPWFNTDHKFCEPAWNGILFNDWGRIRTIFERIKGAFLSLMTNMRDWTWKGDQERNAYIWIVKASLFTSSKSPHLTFDEARDCLRQFDQDALTQVIWFLGRVGVGNDNGWNDMVIPFTQKVWPKERRFQTEKTSKAWVSMLDDTDDQFPAVFNAVRDFLRPIRESHLGLYGFIKNTDQQEPLISRFPTETLDLLNLIMPDDPRNVPYDLSQALNLLLEAEPSIATDRRYERLRELDASR